VARNLNAWETSSGGGQRGGRRDRPHQPGFSLDLGGQEAVVGAAARLGYQRPLERSDPARPPGRRKIAGAVEVARAIAQIALILRDRDVQQPVNLRARASDRDRAARLAVSGKIVGDQSAHRVDVHHRARDIAADHHTKGGRHSPPGAPSTRHRHRERPRQAGEPKQRHPGAIRQRRPPSRGLTHQQPRGGFTGPTGRRTSSRIHPNRRSRHRHTGIDMRPHRQQHRPSISRPRCSRRGAGEKPDRHSNPP